MLSLVGIYVREQREKGSGLAAHADRAGACHTIGGHELGQNLSGWKIGGLIQATVVPRADYGAVATSGLQVVNSARQDSNRLRWGTGSFLSLMSLAEGVSAQLVPLTSWEPCLSWMWDITEPFKSSQADEAVEHEEASMHLTRCCKGLAVNACAHAIFFCKLLHDLRQSGTEKGLPTSLGDSHGLKVGIISGRHLGKQLA
ncbi:hypothetical protein QYF61_017825 [Mycteria americana]|uniref:Uncharacterized protein n=1 Tax=Mycteria americana TaxID=33587 RepID=A0AAN7RZI6_MYCAM|nr:hypothetical protein QYF61_017825 [Mycteria americana]